MKRISHGKDKLEPRQKKTAGFFIFARLITTFTKSFRSLGQVQIEYMVLFGIITAVVLIVGIIGIRGCPNRPSMVENVRDKLDVEVLQKAVDEMQHTVNCDPCPPCCTNGLPCCQGS